MSSIADAAGVTKPVVYECFANKDELFQSLLRREEKRLLDSVASALPKDLDFSDLEGLLTASYTAFFTAVADSPDSWRLVVTSQQGLSAVTRRLERAREAIVEQISQMVFLYLSTHESGQPERESTVIAETLASVAESGARILLSEGSDWRPDELAAFMTKGLILSWI